MKIKSLELTNFKQFYGNQIVDISTSSDKNVTVFRGVNGTGKTSLFTAINFWAGVFRISFLTDSKYCLVSLEIDPLTARM